MILAAVFAFYIPAQTTTTTTTNTKNITPSASKKPTPQWVRDLRRWEIVAFGSIPFTMFTAAFAMDMYRWNNANGMDFNDRRYAPWPLKSTGAVAMKSEEQKMVFLIAGSLSVAIAMTDQVIVQIKRYKARKRAEALPSGTTVITRKPWPEETSEEQDGIEADDAVPVTPELPSPEQP